MCTRYTASWRRGASASRAQEGNSLPSGSSQQNDRSPHSRSARRHDSECERTTLATHDLKRGELEGQRRRQGSALKCPIPALSTRPTGSGTPKKKSRGDPLSLPSELSPYFLSYRSPPGQNLLGQRLRRRSCWKTKRHSKPDWPGRPYGAKKSLRPKQHLRSSFQTDVSPRPYATAPRLRR